MLYLECMRLCGLRTAHNKVTRCNMCTFKGTSLLTIGQPVLMRQPVSRHYTEEQILSSTFRESFQMLSILSMISM